MNRLAASAPYILDRSDGELHRQAQSMPCHGMQSQPAPPQELRGMVGQAVPLKDTWQCASRGQALANCISPCRCRFTAAADAG